MKNKKSIYILLPVVLLIWGLVLYQFFSFTATAPEVNQSHNFTLKPIVLKKKDTFSIAVNERDPFLGKIITAGNKPSGPVVKKAAPLPKIKEELVWPAIQYKGIVSDTKDKVKVYMVLINGKTHLMKKGEKEQDITLKDGDRETIYATYKGEIRVIFIQ